MPVQVSYPGVYIEEIPSGQHVITGVATSITAFVGRAVCGPTDEPITIFSFGDYERIFGGLSYNYPMSYAVKDFYLNGGSQAIIVRLFKPDTDLSESDWSSKSQSAAQATIDAVNAVDATKTPDDAKTAAQTKAKDYTSDPEQSAAQNVVDAVNEAAKDAKTAKDVQDSLQKIAISTFIPAYPISSITLSSYTWSPVLPAGHSVIKASVDAMFGADGKALPSSLVKPVDIFQAGKSAILKLYNSENIQAARFAKAINRKVSPPASTNTIKDVMDNFIDIVCDTMKSFAIENFSTSIDAYKSSIKTIDGLFNAKGNLKITIQKDGVDNDLKTALETLQGSVAALYTDKNNTLILQAANAGSWGQNLTATVDYSGINDQVAQKYKSYGLSAGDLFNLQIEYTQPGGQVTIERYISVTIKNGTQAPNRLDRELKHQSQLVRVPLNADGTPALPLNIPPDGAFGSAVLGSDGGNLDDLTYIGDEDKKTGIYMLKKTDLFNLLCIPPDIRDSDVDAAVYTEAIKLCVDRRAMLLVDSPVNWTDLAKTGRISDISPTDPSLGINGTDARNAAVYFPRVIKEDLEKEGTTDVFPTCGIIAGVMASTDVNRGVWKAPAGQDAAVMGIQALEINLTDQENGVLNPLGINCLRNFPIIGPVVWGARTLRGADQLADDYKYVPVRRLTLYIEESLYRGTQWAVFEPNDEKLWSSLRLSVNSFLADLQRQGAFYSYSVACDSTTTTQSDIDHGIVNIVVSIAPVKPAEFVVFQIQQVAGQKQS